MKNLKDIIVERLHINKDIKSYNYYPKTNDELKKNSRSTYRRTWK